jgi:hypothetical protein
MRINKPVSLLLSLMVIMCALMTGCGSESPLKIGAEVTESEYFYDEETGIYTALAIVRNNGPLVLEDHMLTAAAFDDEGNRIKNAVIDGGESPFVANCGWLCKGETTACIDTNAAFADSILERYEEVPASIKWESEITNYAVKLSPHGLSVKECQLTGTGSYMGEKYGEYEVTLHNDSGNVYTRLSDPDLGSIGYTCESLGKEFDLTIAAVYRDSEGKIADAVLLRPGEDDSTEISAEGDTKITFQTYNRCDDPDLTPEYYVNIVLYG